MQNTVRKKEKKKKKRLRIILAFYLYRNPQYNVNLWNDQKTLPIPDEGRLSNEVPML